MMVAERATTPESAAPCSEQNNQLESTTTCAYCLDDRDVYQMGDKWICLDHIAQVVSLAACDIWPDLVSYKREFERVLM